MVIKKLDKCDELWNRVADYAKECSWGAGKFLAEQMYGNGFSEWERVIAAFDEENVIGYCTLAKNDCLPDVPYTPYIGYVFVDERYRGNRHSQKMIDFALGYARELGFDKVYLVSDHVNLYEKYGFVKIDEKPAPWNPEEMETIFMHVV